ncbi:hypothetical protein LAJ57_13860, partial [Streptococcus pneumoniae]|uniref:hypothetical protein n=1 Tax=Streptococcus pneumoniae TaxID=1313 RepID=UPI001CC04BA6
MTELQEARLLGRAIRSRWNVPLETKQDVMDTLADICVNGRDESSRIAAAKAIIAAESQNQKEEHLEANEFRT